MLVYKIKIYIPILFTEMTCQNFCLLFQYYLIFYKNPIWMSKTEVNSLPLYLRYCIIMNHHSLLKALWLHMHKMWTLFLKFRATGFQEMWQSHQFDSFEYLFILTICITSSLITSKYIKDTNYLWNTEINKMINLFWTSTTKGRERLVNDCLQFTECNSILYNKKRRNMWEQFIFEGSSEMPEPHMVKSQYYSVRWWIGVGGGGVEDEHSWQNAKFVERHESKLCSGICEHLQIV